MTKQDNPEVDASVRHNDSTASPGRLLQQAREKKSLTLESVANVLRISRAKMLALEADRYEDMPAEAFVRGYIRAYCKLVDLDEAELIARYEESLNAQRVMHQSVQVQEVVPVTWFGPALVRFWFVPVVLVVLFLIWVVFGPDQKVVQTSEVGPAAAQAVEPKKKASDPVQGPAEMMPEPTRSASITEEQPASAIEPAPVTVVSPAPATSPGNGFSAVADILILQFTDECWLEVSDAKGDVLAADLKQAGDSVELQGTAPFNVMLGNARAVKVTLNGRAVETEPNGINRALRLQVK